MNYKIIQQTFVKVAKVLRFCGPPLKMKRGLMIPKHVTAWMKHHINRSLMCLFDFWPTWVAKVVHVSSLMKRIVGELRLCYWHLTPLLTNMVLTFQRWMQVRHSSWPDLCAYGDDAWRLLSWRLFGETEFKEWMVLGCFESSCVRGLRRTLAEEYIQKTTWRCNATLHSMQPWTLKN